jgi:hypothetical protein
LDRFCRLADLAISSNVRFGPIPLKKSVFEQDGRNSQREPTAS